VVNLPPNVPRSEIRVFLAVLIKGHQVVYSKPSRVMFTKNRKMDPRNTIQLNIRQSKKTMHRAWVWPPPRIPVTTRIITFVVGDPYAFSFATGMLGGGHTRHTVDGRNPAPLGIPVFTKSYTSQVL